MKIEDKVTQQKSNQITADFIPNGTIFRGRVGLAAYSIWLKNYSTIVDLRNGESDFTKGSNNFSTLQVTDYRPVNAYLVIEADV